MALSKKKFLFYTDALLIPIIILLIYTGLKIHIVAHYDNHEIWHQWSVFHIITSLIFLFLMTIHLKLHWQWYKVLPKKFGNKKIVTLILSILFIIELATGIILLVAIEGANSSVGFLHYIIGIMCGILCIGHFIKRFPLFIKGLKTLII